MMNKGVTRVLVYGMVGTNRGGIETYLLKMNSYMSMNTVFDYVIEGDTCIFSDEIKARGGEIFHINVRSKYPIRNIIDNFRLLKSLKQNVKAVYFNISSLSWLIPVRIAYLLGYSVFVHAHNSEFIAANSGLIYKMVYRFNKRLLSRWKVRRLTCSDLATAFMFRKDDSVTMIYNAVDVGKFRFQESTRENVRKALSIGSESLVGFIGRLAYQKNPLYLIRIMKALLAMDPRARMLIIGDGDMRQQLEAMRDQCGMHDSILIIGNRTDVNELMQAMDILILPSHHEGLPYVVIEALCSGLPCLVSDKVTRQIDIFGNITFLPIAENADIWAERILSAAQCKNTDRTEAYCKLEQSRFNIAREALCLEDILNER